MPPQQQAPNVVCNFNSIIFKSSMRIRTPIGIMLFLLVACTENSNYKRPDISKLSTIQKVQTLVDSFKIEYSSASSISKDSVLEKYNEKIYDYLSHHFLDSIQVQVDTIIINDWTVTTRCHYSRDIAFQYGLTFNEGMTAHFDTLFQFMKGLPIRSDTTVSFIYMDTHKLSPNADLSSPTLTIFANPSPIFWKTH